MSRFQSDIVALRDQISSVVGAAQFNGLNLLGWRDNVDILSSLDRASDGSVTTANINVASSDLRTKETVIAADATYVAGSATSGAAAATLNATQSTTLTIAGVPAAIAAGTAFSIGLTGTDADFSSFVAADVTTAATVAGASNIVYVAKDTDTVADVAKGLEKAWKLYAAENSIDTETLDFTATATGLTATSGVTTGTDTIGVRVDTMTSATAGFERGGGLEALGTVDVSTAEGSAAALVEHRRSDPDSHRLRCRVRFLSRSDRNAIQLRHQADQLAQVGHRVAGRRGHGGGLGPSPGAADPAAARRAGPVDRQPGTADHHAAVPLSAAAGRDPSRPALLIIKHPKR